ncbi:MAG TPA: WYL domain-containing protein [Chloroflexota bacterium]|nr:WYL domain-containing protein [Chloroflexota bacterium]
MNDERHAGRLEEVKRISRVLRIVQLIASRPRIWSRRKLAAEFEVSERMIDNDLQIIRHALRYDLRRDRNGYYFADGPSLGPLTLSVPEALALLVSAEQARDTGSVDPGTIASALAHLEGALPAGIIPHLQRSRGSGNAGRSHALELLRLALAEGRWVEIEYSSASRDGAISRRRIAPYHLMPYERSWLVIAADSLRERVLMFKVDRIRRCRLTDDAFELPADFDPETYLGSTWGVLRGEAGRPEEVVLHFSPLAASWVRDDVWHPSQTVSTEPDGSLIMRFNCGITHELVRWVLSFGGEVTVELPEHLRNSVVEEARRAVDRQG